MKAHQRIENVKRNKTAHEGAVLDPASGISDEDLLVSKVDPRFQAELDYEGYDDIEGLDNDELNADVNGKGDPERKLEFQDRPEINSGEEDSTDRQENRS